MAITTNDLFTAGQVLTATECNNFPRGVMAFASSPTTYTLTATDTQTTGMTVTFTAAAGRNYKITYYEPNAEGPSAALGTTSIRLHVTNTAGTLLQQGLYMNPNLNKNIATLNIVWVGTLTAGSTTIIGSALVSVTTGTPLLNRAATTPAFLIVEDIGTA